MSIRLIGRVSERPLLASLRRIGIFIAKIAETGNSFFPIHIWIDIHWLVHSLTGRVEMSVAYYIVLDNEDPGFDTFVNGKFLAKETEKIDAICEKLGVKKFSDFLVMSEDDISDMLGEDVELSEDEGEQWFSAEEGIAFVTALTTHINTNPKNLKNAEGVLGDLAEYAKILEKTKSIGAKWRLNIDI
jgi:hypothetical protein